MTEAACMNHLLKEHGDSIADESAVVVKQWFVSLFVCSFAVSHHTLSFNGFCLLSPLVGCHCLFVLSMMCGVCGSRHVVPRHIIS
jgi:hypothetical protein